jgi:hypothetical protein
MTTIHAHPVDPRDSAWELWNPSYRVCFWSRHGDGWLSRVFDIADVDVDAVLGWVAENDAESDAFTVSAVVDHGADRGLIRLAGNDPTRDA